MKAREFQELQSLSAKELDVKLSEKKEELFNLRFRHATGQLENPVSLRNCRRDIARIKTVLRSKEIKA